MIKAIVAVRKGDRGIGFKNDLPWRIPSDLKHFKECTKGGTVVMGWNTMLSLGSKPLPGRRNLVITRFKTKVPEGFENIHMGCQFRDVVGYLSNLEGDVWIIGGAATYELFMDHIDSWVVTVVDAPDVPCDRFLPEIPYQVKAIQKSTPDERDEFPYEIHYYQR
jgi:dihydrofolate reductase